MHRGEHADAAAGHADDRPLGLRGVESDQRGAVAAEREHQVAVPCLDGLGEPARLALGGYLAEPHPLLGGPGLDLRQSPGDVADRMGHES